MFIPAVRSSYSSLIRRSRIREAKDLSYLFLPPTKKNMVVIPFRHLPHLKRFRWNKTWWKKTSWKGGTNEELHELEIPPNAFVGVILEDLTKEAKNWIIK